MQMTEYAAGRVIVFSPDGDLMSIARYEPFRKRLHQLKRQGMTHVVVDLKNVRLINSSGITMLIGGMKTLRESGGDLRLANLGDRAKFVVVDICGLDHVFGIFESIDDAVESYT